VDGNSIGKTLYEDIQTWEELIQGVTPPDIKRQRLEELTGEKNFNIHLSWDEAFKNVALAKRQYMKAMLLNGEDLSKPPRIKVSTIHGAKGGEATNVVLFLNQTANTIKGAKKSQAKQEEEYRVWYVGVTRTIKNLYLIKCKNRLKEFKI
jgi:superfamily I DNA/RNA helicase